MERKLTFMEVLLSAIPSTFLNLPMGTLEFLTVEGPLKLRDEYFAHGNTSRIWQGCILSITF